MLLPYSASIKIVLLITLISFSYGWWDEFQLLNFYVIFLSIQHSLKEDCLYLGLYFVRERGLTEY